MQANVFILDHHPSGLQAIGDQQILGGVIRRGLQPAAQILFVAFGATVPQGFGYAQNAMMVQSALGDLDAAFALARARQQPLFLYWGAVWCPPCNQLKAGLFKDPAFIALTSKFVPVYLDG